MRVVAPTHLQAIRFTLLALSLVAIGGCTQVLYNRSDKFAAWYLESLVSLEESQRTELRAWLQDTLRWHRDSELARYAAFVRRIAEQAAQPQSRESFAEAARQVGEYWDAIVTRSTPAAVDLLMGLSEQQVQELITNLEERGRERGTKDRKLVEAGRWNEQRSRDMQRQFKRWTGSIRDEQRELIESTAERLEPTYNDWQATQARWRAALRATLLSSGEDKREVLASLLRNPQQHWTEQYTLRNDANRELVIAMLAQLDSTLSEQQRRHLQNELFELAEQLESMRENAR